MKIPIENFQVKPDGKSIFVSDRVSYINSDKTVRREIRLFPDGKVVAKAKNGQRTARYKCNMKPKEVLLAKTKSEEGAKPAAELASKKEASHETAPKQLNEVSNKGEGVAQSSGTKDTQNSEATKKIEELQQQINALKKIEELERQLAELKAAQTGATEVVAASSDAVDKTKRTQNSIQEQTVIRADQKKPEAGPNLDVIGGALAAGAAVAALSSNTDGAAVLGSLGAITQPLLGSQQSNGVSSGTGSASLTPPSTTGKKTTALKKPVLKVDLMENSYLKRKNEIDAVLKTQKVDAFHLDFMDAKVKTPLSQFLQNNQQYIYGLDLIQYPERFKRASSREEKKAREAAINAVKSWPHGKLKYADDANFSGVAIDFEDEAQSFLTCVLKLINEKLRCYVGYVDDTFTPSGGTDGIVMLLRLENHKFWNGHKVELDDFYDGDVIGIDVTINQIQFPLRDIERAPKTIFASPISLPVLVRENYAKATRPGMSGMEFTDYTVNEILVTKAGGPYEDEDPSALAAEKAFVEESKSFSDVATQYYAVEACYYSREGYLSVYINIDEFRSAKLSFNTFLKDVDLPKTKIDEIIQDIKVPKGKAKAMGSNYNPNMSESCKSALFALSMLVNQ